MIDQLEALLRVDPQEVSGILGGYKPTACLAGFFLSDNLK
jgi:hypothetical protein